MEDDQTTFFSSLMVMLGGYIDRSHAICDMSKVLNSTKIKATFPLTRCTLVPKGLQSRWGQFIQSCVIMHN